MAKKNKSAVNIPVTEPAAPAAPAPVAQSAQWHFSSFRVQAVILAIIGLVFYCNTFTNENALDDNPIIVNNEYVQSGVAGIPHIMTGDALESFYSAQNVGGKLTGGRYRPLSIVTFAIEQQILGVKDKTVDPKNAPAQATTEKLVSDMHFRHVVNVLLYILSVIVVLLFLRKIVFPKDPLAAFIAALIFTIHPIHTEVVANVKSRDEILSMLFICLTFIKAFKYKETNKPKDLFVACLCFLLALLSKEYAVMLLALLPLSFYVFRKDTVKDSSKAILPYLIPFAIYMLLRISSVTTAGADAGENIINNPYAYATATQKIASVWAVMLDYIRLLVFPNTLSADYSYAQIPYSGLGSVKVLLSLAIYLLLVVAMAVFIKKQRTEGFAIAIYLGFLLLVSNLIFNVGAPMGERFLFHPSLGFAIIIALALSYAANKVRSENFTRYGIGTLLLVLVAASGFRTITRNADWHSDKTLFLKDVQTVPNSSNANAFAGSACLHYAEDLKDSTQQREWYLKGIQYLNKAIAIYSKNTDAYANRGIGYFRLGDFDKAMADCDTVTLHYPNHPSLVYLAYVLSDHYFNMAMELCQKGDFASSFPLFKKAIEAEPNEPELWYNMGYAYYSARDFVNARNAANYALKLNPAFGKAQQLLKMCTPKEEQH